MKTLKAVVLSLTLVVGSMQAMDVVNGLAAAAWVGIKSVPTAISQAGYDSGQGKDFVRGSLIVRGAKEGLGIAALGLAYHKWVWPHVQTVVTKSGNVVAAGARPLYNVGAAGAGKLYDVGATGARALYNQVEHWVPVGWRLAKTTAAQGGKIAVQGGKIIVAGANATGKLATNVASNVVHAVQDEYNELNQERSRSPLATGPQVTAQDKEEERLAKDFRNRFGAK